MISSKDNETASLFIFLILIPYLWNSASKKSDEVNPEAKTSIATVSKYYFLSVIKTIPCLSSSSINIYEKNLTLVAIFLSPAGPCHYI